MSTRLERFLETIDPSKILDLIEKDIDRAVARFSHRGASVGTFKEYERVLAEFCHDLQRQALHLRSPVDLDVARYSYMAIRILENEYGPTARTATFELARTNQRGGLYAILKAVARGMAQEYSANAVGSAVSSYLSSLSASDILADADEYVDKYRHLIPPELLEGGAVRLRGYFHKVLENHPFLMQAMRRVGR